MKSISTIVAPVELSPTARVALDSSCHLAELFHAERVHLVHVVPCSELALDVAAYRGALKHETTAAHIASAKGRLDDLSWGDVDVEIIREMRIGVPAREILECAEQCGADLLVLATANRESPGQPWLGSVAHTVLRAAHCPILIVGLDRPWRRPRRIVAGIDLSRSSAAVSDRALTFARAAGAEVDLVSSCELLWRSEEHLEPRERRALHERHRNEIDALIQRFRDEAIAVSTTTSTTTAPATLILQHAAETGADLIVVGSSGHHAWEQLFLGSTATRVVARAHCPVLVVPPAVTAS
jgi:nucleotide-binding universal stress UspA family protein